MICVLLLLIWVLYSIIEGKREGIFWHHRILSKDYEIFKNYDRHSLFMLQRGLVLLILFLFYFYSGYDLYKSFLLVIMNSLIFSFFHNGMMYYTRNKLFLISNPNNKSPVYPKKWFDQSSTSTAFFTKYMNPISRTIQMIIGLIGYFLLIFKF